MDGVGGETASADQWWITLVAAAAQDFVQQEGGVEGKKSRFCARKNGCAATRSHEVMVVYHLTT
jgi:hypothetical protein